MTDSFTQGNVAYIDEEFDEAIRHYDEALKAAPRDATILSCRAAALIKKKKFMKALEDVNKAISIDPHHDASYFRKGVACFELEEYETSKASFEKGLSLRSNAPGSKDVTAYQRWIRKCSSELTSNRFTLFYLFCLFSLSLLLLFALHCLMQVEMIWLLSLPLLLLLCLLVQLFLPLRFLRSSIRLCLISNINTTSLART